MIPVQHIHPMLVHFPIVFVLVLAVLDAIATVRGHPVTGRTAIGHLSTGLAVLAALFAIVTVVFGGMALTIAESGGFSSDIAEIHEGLGETVAYILAAWALVRAFLWWRDIRVNGTVSAVFPIAELAAAGLVIATAYYGGQLVFELGVNVAKAAGGA